MLYLYFFEYYNMFLPFVHFTCPEEQEEYVTNLNIVSLFILMGVKWIRFLS